jgi:hypothetical protein
MAKKRLLASVALTAGLLGGGVAGVILGVPGVSGAQTTTTVPDQPGTTVPDDATRAPRGDKENCPEKEGGTEGRAPGRPVPNGSSTNAGFGRGAGGRV